MVFTKNNVNYLIQICKSNIQKAREGKCQKKAEEENQAFRWSYHPCRMPGR